MTHEKYLESEGGFISDKAPDAICRLAMELGVRNFVLPGTKTNIVHRFASGLLEKIKPADVMMPGIGAQGGAIDKAFTAAFGHNTYAIIGSAIYSAENPKTAIEAFATEISK